ncbi:hypothetical protein MKW94_000440, partial [Papaver nudicaule]|nr:hypothetical protein [Papaver nudicaule]
VNQARHEGTSYVSVVGQTMLANGDEQGQASERSMSSQAFVDQIMQMNPRGLAASNGGGQ